MRRHINNTMNISAVRFTLAYGAQCERIETGYGTPTARPQRAPQRVGGGGAWTCTTRPELSLLWRRLPRATVKGLLGQPMCPLAHGLAQTNIDLCFAMPDQSAPMAGRARCNTYRGHAVRQKTTAEARSPRQARLCGPGVCVSQGGQLERNTTSGVQLSATPSSKMRTQVGRARGRLPRPTTGRQPSLGLGERMSLC